MTKLASMAKTHRALLLAPLFLSALHTEGSAAVIVDYSPIQPVDDIIVSFAPTGGTPGNIGWVNEPGLIRNIAQTFTIDSTGATAYNASHLTISVTRPSSAPALSNFTLSFYEIAGVGSNPVPGSAPISTQGGSVLVNADPTSTYLTFALESPVLLEAGKSYSFVLGFDEPQSPQRFLVGYSEFNSSVGQAWFTPDGVWTRANQTFTFFVQGEAIPEASTLALLPAGFLLLAFAARYRRSEKRA